MKRNKIYSALAALMLTAAATSCEGEKDLIIIEGNLPIKTTTLYMVGDATPNGWSIDNPTPLVASDDDPLIFSWQGVLYSGEVKLCLTTGSWDAPFIRPVEHGMEIGRNPITNQTFDMHAGDPDNKWRVTDAGEYLLTFDLRNWTMSTAYIKELDAPTIEPIESETLYIVGDATPNGWSIDDPTLLEKTGTYTYVYDGPLTKGEMKACLTPGSWDVPFVRPATDGVRIDENGAEAADFVYSNSPDNKWHIEAAGIYRLTFDLEHWTITAEYKGELVIDKTPIETSTVFMIGDATPNGWGMDDATEYTQDANNHYIFTWTGELVEGWMKACIVKDPSYACPFIRPERDGIVINESGVETPEFVFTTGPDDKWHVTKAGIYTITFDLEHYTINAKYEGAGSEPEPVEKEPIVTETLYIVGNSTPNSWDIGNPTLLTKTGAYTFVYEGPLTNGEMKACLVTGSWDVPFVRPAVDGTRIDHNGVASADFIFTAGEPDYKWHIEEAGDYRLTFDLEHWTITAEYLGEVVVEKTPIETSTVYMIGQATPNGWSMDSATELTQSASNKYIFTWTGHLGEGEMKACLVKDGTFSCPFIRPERDGVVINQSGVEAPGFIFTAGDPDHKWHVTKAGTYTITFDLEHWTITAAFVE